MTESRTNCWADLKLESVRDFSETSIACKHSCVHRVRSEYSLEQDLVGSTLDLIRSYVLKVTLVPERLE